MSWTYVIEFNKKACNTRVHRCELMIPCLSYGPLENFCFQNIACQFCRKDVILVSWAPLTALASGGNLRYQEVNILPPCLPKNLKREEKKGFLAANYMCEACQRSGVLV